MGIPPNKGPGKHYGFPSSSAGLEPYPSITLGAATVSPINMANAFATIANGGRFHEPYIIEKVVDKDGEVLYDHSVSDEQAIDDEQGSDIAADVSYALQQVVSVGTGTAALGLGRPAAGKTGTATNDKDQVSSAWFTGYTPQLATSVMYVRGKGNEQLDGWLPSYFGGTYPAQTWTAVMERDMDGVDVEDFPEPAYVDGEAPDEGHQPTLPPKPTKTPSRRTRRPRPSSRPRRRPWCRLRRPPHRRRRRPIHPPPHPRTRRSRYPAATSPAARRRARPRPRPRRRPGPRSRWRGGTGCAGERDLARRWSGRWPRPPDPGRPRRRGPQRGRGRAGGEPRRAAPLVDAGPRGAAAGRGGLRARDGPEERLLQPILGLRRRTATPTCATRTCPTSTPAAGWSSWTGPTPTTRRCGSATR